MKLCPRCESGYPDSFDTCPIHGLMLGEIRDLKPGMLIRNTYRIVRKLGQGGMGAVYLADHILLNEPQVLKFLSSELSQDQDLTSRFLREVRTLRQIRHKNVINAGNLEPAEDGTLFFSMEFVDGPDLRSFVRHSPQPFDVWLALDITRGISEGLGAAHDKGMVHRDIKPENILMARDNGGWVPKIVDFGIVATRENSRSTQVGSSLLTPLFAAPEQWRGMPGSQLDGRTDLYALGGLLFEMLTGRSVFDAENYHGWSQMHLNVPPRAPSSVRPELAAWRGLDDLVLKLLAKDREQRPRDVATMLGMLDAIDYSPLSSRSTPRPSQSPNTAPGSRPMQSDPVAASHRPPQYPAPAETRGASIPPEPVASARLAPQSPASSAPRVPAQARSGAAVQEPPLFDPVKTRRPPEQETEQGTLREIRPARGKQQKEEVPLMVWLALVAVVILGGTVAERILVPEVRFRVLQSQTDAILSVAFSPNGLTLASASRDNTIQVWEVNDGRALRTMQDGVESLAFSSDGRTLASGMWDNTVKLWDATSGQVLGTMQGHTDHVPSVAFSPDGRTVASASWDRTIKLWDVASGQLLRTLRGHTDRVFSVAFNADGRTLVSSSSDLTLKIWDASSGTVLRSIISGARPVNSVAFSPDGRLIAAGSDDTTVRIWDPATGQLVRSLEGHTAPVTSISFSPDGRMLASASSDLTVRLWNVSTGSLLRELKGHTGSVLTVAFGPFGRTVASGSADKTIRLWDVNGVEN
jgi:serine/threonine protein kinase/uncharacterized protein YjiK